MLQIVTVIVEVKADPGAVAVIAVLIAAVLTAVGVPAVAAGTVVGSAARQDEGEGGEDQEEYPTPGSLLHDCAPLFSRRRSTPRQLPDRTTSMSRRRRAQVEPDGRRQRVAPPDPRTRILPVWRM